VSGRPRGRAHGGRGGAEPRRRIQARELQVLELFLAGRTQHQIAATVGISQAAVSKILQRIEERALTDLSNRVERQRARQTLRLEYIVNASMRAWHASQTDRLRKRQRKTDADGVAATVAELVSENRHGDPRYLAEARAALKDLRAIWGLEAPRDLTVAVTGPFTAMSDSALDETLTRYGCLLALDSPGIDATSTSLTPPVVESDPLVVDDPTPETGS
jgi:DNA-binding CsgD family transcriptional regulator